MNASCQTNRRNFLKTTVAALAAGAPYDEASRVFASQSANDRLRIGCIGAGGMGTGDARAQRAVCGHRGRM